MRMGMSPPLPQRLGLQRNTDMNNRMEQPDDGLLYERRPPGKFPARKKHIIAHGEPRTASTLLYNMVGVSNFLHLSRHEPHLVSDIEAKFVKDERDFHDGSENTTKIFKTHVDLDKFLKYDAVIFTSTTTSKKAAALKSHLEEQGHDVAHVQDMETLKSGGIKRIAADFAFGYDLCKDDEEMLVEYMTKWEVLRQCCGQQMSSSWRNDLLPEVYKKEQLKPHPFCKDYDIDEIENAFMKTKLFSLLDAYHNMRQFNKPSLRDGELNGSYCSSYNERIKTEALNFYGQPRPLENIKTGSWTEEEHNIFLEGVKIHGSNKPNRIANMIGTRTEIQVLKHLNDYIRTGFHDADNEERTAERPIRTGIDVTGEVAFAYDEKGELILVNKASSEKLQAYSLA